MKTNLFRKNHLSSRLRIMRLALLLLPLLGRGLGGGGALVAQTQNGVKVTGLEVNAGTVTFNVSWEKPMPVEVWVDSAWVFVDYNKNGVMERLPVTSATATAGTVTKISGNDKGVWVAGDARTKGSFSAIVQLFTDIQGVAGACAYASNYPPVGEYISASEISFTGTPEYKVVLERGNESTYTVTVGKGESLPIPNGEAALSFTDKTGAPGKFICMPSSTYTLTASALGFCADEAGVTFSLSGTEKGRSYELYKDGAPTAVATLTGTGSAAPFDGVQTEGTYTARVLASLDGYCEAEMSGTPITISRNPLPEAPVISQPADVCFNNGSIVFTASDYTGSLTWVSNGGGSVNGSSVTFASGAATGTKTVKAQSSRTYTNAPTCYSAEVTQFATVNPIPTITHNTNGGAATQRVILGAAISAISYTASNSATFTKTGSIFPDGLNVSASGSSYTIYGTPTSAGTYGYSLTASVNGCASTAAEDTITVIAPIPTSMGGPNTAYSETTWIIGTGSSAQTWSDRIVVTPVCTNSATFTTSNYTTAEYKEIDGRYYYSWTCASKNAATFCPADAGWRVPDKEDLVNLFSYMGGDTQDARDKLLDAWGVGGRVDGAELNMTSAGVFWSSYNLNGHEAYHFYFGPTHWSVRYTNGETYRGMQVRCVK